MSAERGIFAPAEAVKFNGHLPTQENPRLNSRALEFQNLAKPHQLKNINIKENDFPFYTKDGRLWIVDGSAVFSNGHCKIPNGFKFSEFLHELEGLQQGLRIIPNEEPHNGVVDLIWKNWEKLWEHFEPDMHYAVPTRCFREVRLNHFNGTEEEIGQPDLIGISPRGSVNILEVGALGLKKAKRAKIRRYEEKFRSMFGDSLMLRSFVVAYEQIEKGFRVEMIDPSVLN